MGKQKKRCRKLGAGDSMGMHSWEKEDPDGRVKQFESVTARRLIYVCYQDDLPPDPDAGTSTGAQPVEVSA